MVGKKKQRVNDKNIQGQNSQGVPADDKNEKENAEQVFCEKLI